MHALLWVGILLNSLIIVVFMLSLVVIIIVSYLAFLSRIYFASYNAFDCWVSSAIYCSAIVGARFVNKKKESKKRAHWKPFIDFGTHNRNSQKKPKKQTQKKDEKIDVFYLSNAGWLKPKLNRIRGHQRTSSTINMYISQTHSIIIVVSKRYML